MREKHAGAAHDPPRAGGPWIPLRSRRVMAGDDEEDVPSRRGTLAALLIIAALIAGGLWLVHVLGNAGRIQDCIASGRSNCAPIAATPGR